MSKNRPNAWDSVAADMVSVAVEALVVTVVLAVLPLHTICSLLSRDLRVVHNFRPSVIPQVGSDFKLPEYVPAEQIFKEPSQWHLVFQTQPYISNLHCRKIKKPANFSAAGLKFF